MYRADGTKVKKLFGDIETNYLDGLQYKSTKPSEAGSIGGPILIDPTEVAEMKLRIIPTAEGYFDAVMNQYIYNYTDHLGNVKLSYSDTNKDGVIQPRQYNNPSCTGGTGPFDPPMCIDNWKPGEIVEVNSYYPFGLMHNYTATTQNAYQYKYNGKELQESGMYDYGARFYMPDIGRWGVVDAMAEALRRHTPYNYAYNNPIRFIDPDGNFSVSFSGEAAQQAFTAFRANMSIGEDNSMEIINGETLNRKILQKDVKQREFLINSQYAGNKNLNKKDFNSRADFNKYHNIITGLNTAQNNLNVSLAIESDIQASIDLFKIVDPENFNLINNLQYNDANGINHNLDVLIQTGNASSYGGAFTGTKFTSKLDTNGNPQYFGIHSIVTTLDFKKLAKGAFAHEMGHIFNIAKNPAQSRLQGAGDTGTINCQLKANRNTFQSQTAMDWQERYIIRHTAIMLNLFGR